MSESAALIDGPVGVKGSVGGLAVITDARGSIGGSGMIDPRLHLTSVF